MVHRSEFTKILIPPNKDPYSQTTSIVIDTVGSVKVNVFYKLRDTFTFKVGAGLTIRNIAFNATDSTINFLQDSV